MFFCFQCCRLLYSSMLPFLAHTLLSRWKPAHLLTIRISRVVPEPQWPFTCSGFRVSELEDAAKTET
jgi:hypothetical protein